MAIAFDAATDTGFANATTYTVAHTTSGSNRILFVGAFDDVSGGSKITGVTYSGVAMTQIGSAVINPSTGRYTTLWVLVNPASGTNNIVMSVSPSGIIGGAAVSYTGAAQSGQPDSQNADTASIATAIAPSTTVVGANAWLVMFAYNTDQAPSAGTGTTKRAGTNAGQGGLFDSGSTVGTGSQSLEATTVSVAVWSAQIASFLPASAGNPHYYYDQLRRQ